jgi:hypothetical protein
MFGPSNAGRRLFEPPAHDQVPASRFYASKTNRLYLRRC